MAYTYEGWTLYSRDVTLKGGKKVEEIKLFISLAREHQKAARRVTSPIIW